MRKGSLRWSCEIGVVGACSVLHGDGNLIIANTPFAKVVVLEVERRLIEVEWQRRSSENGISDKLRAHLCESISRRKKEKEKESDQGYEGKYVMDQ